MKKTGQNKARSRRSKDLRTRAVRVLSEGSKKLQDLPDTDVRELVQELRIHQAELEMQNQELREAYEALEVSRGAYRELYLQAPFGYVTTDREGVIIEANFSAAEILGVERDALPQTSFARFSAEDSRDFFYLHARSVLKHCRPQTGEMQVARGDETRRKIHITSVPVIDSDGGAVEVRNALVDVTEQRELQSALLHQAEQARKAGERLGVILDMTPDAVVLLDLAGYVLYVNRAACGVFECGEEDLIGEHLGLPVSGGEFAEVQIRGSRTAEMRVREIDWMGRPALVATLRDITARKGMERELRRSEEKFRRFFEDSPEYCYMVSPEGLVLDANRAVRETLGYEKAELVAKPVATLFAAQSREQAAQLLVRWRKTGTLKNEELVVVTKGGVERSVLLSVSTVRDKQGEALYAIFTQRDITEHKQLQAQLAQADRMASVGLLAAGIAHEINNPLTYVLYNLQSLVKDLPELTDALARYQLDLGQVKTAELLGGAIRQTSVDHLDDIVSQAADAAEGADRIRTIVKDLKTFSRVDEDRFVLTSLNDVIESAINMAFNELKYRARVVKEYGELPSLIANDGKLAQVFLNLLINAAHAITEGDVEHNEIRVRTWVEGEQVAGEVTDTGKGISAEDLPHIFNPFFTTKDIGAGSGLGLPISLSIVLAHNGTIDVESGAENGTRFVVRLPIQPAVAARKPLEAAATAPGSTVRGRILIVDDETHIGEAIRRMVAEDHDAQAVTSGAMARTVLEDDQRFDVIICDLMMPDITGMDLHGWLSEAYPELADRMVFITGGAFTPGARQFLNQVPNPRLEKPFDPQSLMALLRQMVK